jgi:hypothetical protein
MIRSSHPVNPDLLWIKTALKIIQKAWHHEFNFLDGKQVHDFSGEVQGTLTLSGLLFHYDSGQAAVEKKVG